MDQYVGLDVSLKETFVCVVDASGEVVCEKSVGTTPETIAKFIEKKAPSAVRVGLGVACSRPGCGMGCGLSVCR